MTGLVVMTYFWKPDPGSKFAAPYTARDVRNLARQVAKNLTVPHTFAVVTDQPELFVAHPHILFDSDPDIRAIPIDRTTHVSGTCFVRLMTFHPDGKALFGADTVLQIDLDTLIVGNINHLVNRDEDLVMWRNPGRVPWHSPSRPGRPYYNTSLLFHKLGTRRELWERFVYGSGAPARDDQWYLSDRLGPVAAYFDGETDGVYRIAREGEAGTGVWGELPENACIVTTPGSEGKPSNPVVRAANPWLARFAA